MERVAIDPPAKTTCDICQWYSASLESVVTLNAKRCVLASETAYSQDNKHTFLFNYLLFTQNLAILSPANDLSLVFYFRFTLFFLL